MTTCHLICLHLGYLRQSLRVMKLDVTALRKDVAASRVLKWHATGGVVLKQVLCALRNRITSCLIMCMREFTGGRI